MNYYQSRPVSERLNNAREIIDIVQSDPELSEPLAQFGYSETEFVEAARRLEAASTLEVNQEAMLGAQVAATNALTQAIRVMKSAFSADRRFLQAILRDRISLVEELRLHIRMKDKRDAFVRQAIHFYEEAIRHSEVQALILAEYNMTPEAFYATRITQLTSLLEAMRIQQYQLGQARVATQQRRQAMGELDEWVRGFIRTARYAFRGNERQLRKLGLAVSLPS